MANEYTDKPGIIDYWLFAHDFNAAKNGNHLTPSTSNPTFVNDFPVAPDHGINCASASNQWAYRTDANLISGFPLKSDDADKKASWAFWFKPASFATVNYMVAKYHTTNARALAAILESTSTRFGLYWGYNNGASMDPWYPKTGLVAGRTYFVGIAVDGIAKTALVRFHDVTLGTTATYTKTNWLGEMSLSATAPFSIGNRGNFDTSYDYNGVLGGLVVANYVMTAVEFDAIRLGTFNQANPSTLNLAPSMQQVNIAGDYAYQSFIIF